MRKTFFRFLSLLLLLVLCLTGCQSGAGREEEGYKLYFPVSRDISYGGALGTQLWEGDAPTPEQLLEALLDGPTEEGLRSPFPGAVSLQSMELDGELGVLHITLSEQYGGLADMAQTLADACIVMTACQFPEIRQVEISSEGFWSSRPASRTLSPDQLDLETLLP